MNNPVAQGDYATPFIRPNGASEHQRHHGKLLTEEPLARLDESMRMLKRTSDDMTM